MTASQVPDTSTTLLRDVADSQHARWTEFYARYRPMMAAYMREHFPSVDADEAIQETFVTLVSVLPNYVYDPEETGHFHNYLTGILRHRALHLRRTHERQTSVREAGFSLREQEEVRLSEKEEASWRESLYEIALQQLLADKSVQGRTKQVFIRSAVNGESPEAVAAAFRIERNAVDQIKSRMMEKLRGLVSALEKADASICR